MRTKQKLEQVFVKIESEMQHALKVANSCTTREQRLTTWFWYLDLFCRWNAMLVKNTNIFNRSKVWVRYEEMSFGFRTVMNEALAIR